jgi:hypothetical protein
MFPPGRERLETRPSEIISATAVMTMGIVEVAAKLDRDMFSFDITEGAKSGPESRNSTCLSAKRGQKFPTGQSLQTVAPS